MIGLVRRRAAALSAAFQGERETGGRTDGRTAEASFTRH